MNVDDVIREEVAADCAIGPRGDHDAAKRWVEVHNMSLAELRDEAAKITETEKQSRKRQKTTMPTRVVRLRGAR